MASNLNLGFIGGGNMSTAIFKGILKNDAHPPSKIWVSGPRLHSLKYWADMGANTTTKNGEVFAGCDIVFLGVKPGILVEAVNETQLSIPLTMQQNPNKRVLFVSMLAGKSICELHEALSALKKYAFISVIRIMPNTPMTVGAGACLYAPDQWATEGECTMVEKLLNNCGLCDKISESLIDSLGAVTACGPAFMYIVIEALADGAVKQGAPRDKALRYAAQMLVGSGQMVLQSGKHPGLLKDEVCSPGGSTICGVTALENGKIRSTLISAIEAATLRTKEMGKVNQSCNLMR